MAITPLPTAHNRSVPSDVFYTRSDACVASLPPLTDEVNANAITIDISNPSFIGSESSRAYPAFSDPGLSDFYISTKDKFLIGISSNNDGSKIYMAGFANDSVHEYRLTTPYDISTMTTVSRCKTVAIDDTNPKGLSFSSDGAKSFMFHRSIYNL